MTDNRTPPHDVDIERSLIGAILVDSSQLANVTAIVNGDDFHDKLHGDLFDAIALLHEAGHPVHDMALLVPLLKRYHCPVEVGYLAKLVGCGGTAAHATYYAHQIRRLSQLRAMMDIGTQLEVRARQVDADPLAIADWAQGKLATILQRRVSQARLIGDIAAESVAKLNDAEAQPRGTMTGILSVDNAVGSLMPSELVVLAARPGCGKTSLAMQVGLHTARKARGVLFVSLEMSEEELANRVLCQLSGVNSRSWRTNRLSDDDRNRLREAACDLQGLPLRIWAPTTATAGQVLAVAKLHARTDDLRLVVVDYVGLVRPDDHRRPRHEQVAVISAAFKALAKELAVPVLLLSQLNREADGARPRLSHLRESGAIEQDADVCLFLHHEDDKADECELIVAKHRHGDVGCVPLRFVREATRFDDPRTSAFDEYNNKF